MPRTVELAPGEPTASSTTSPSRCQGTLEIPEAVARAAEPSRIGPVTEPALPPRTVQVKEGVPVELTIPLATIRIALLRAEAALLGWKKSARRAAWGVIPPVLLIDTSVVKVSL